MKKTIAVILLTLLSLSAVACKSKTEVIEVPATTAEFRYGDEVMSYDGYKNLDFTKYLKIPDLSTIKVSLTEVNESWEEAARIIRYEYITFSAASSNDAAQLGDQVNILYKGKSASPLIKLSSETLTALTNHAYDGNGELTGGTDLTLGSGAFVGAYESETHPSRNNPGFEEQLIGVKAGETRNITVTFPDDYSNEELRGTVINFEVTVNSMRNGTIPELTDAMVKEFTEGDHTTVESLRNYVIAYHKNRLAYPAVTEAFTVTDHPDEALDSAIARYVSDYIKMNYDRELTEEETRTVYNEQYKKAQKNAKETVGERLILEYLFKQFSITLTDSEYVEMRDADYEENAFTYLYYYDVTSVEEYESLFGKDVLTVRYKTEKLMPRLSDAIVFE